MKYRCTQYRSSIRVCHAQRRVLHSMGLDKLGKCVVLKECSEILGMIRKVQHLVKVKVC